MVVQFFFEKKSVKKSFKSKLTVKQAFELEIIDFY